MKAYHTCSDKGGLGDVLQKAPFLSRNTDQTWLTQGYYFWTDSPYFAYQWGEDAYNNQYFIFEYILNFTENKRYLDLTSIMGQLYFDDIKSKIKFKGEINYTVNGVISFLRDKTNKMEKLFPFIAIKAKDAKCKNKILFVRGKKETLSILERHQICVFKEAKDIITFTRIEHPHQ